MKHFLGIRGEDILLVVCVCMVIAFSRLVINQVWSPILLVLSCLSPSDQDAENMRCSSQTANTMQYLTYTEVVERPQYSDVTEYRGKTAAEATHYKLDVNFFPPKFIIILKNECKMLFMERAASLKLIQLYY